MRAPRAAYLLALVLALPSTAAAVSLPVTGSLQYLMRHGGSADGDSSTNHSTTLELGTAVPIWRHWLGRLEGRALLSQTYSNGPDGRGSDQVVSGRGDLSVFPQSNFPMTAYLERSDSRVDGANDLDSDRQVTRYGVRQRYDSDWLGRYQLSYDRRRTEQNLDFGSIDDTEVSVQDQVAFTARKRFQYNELDYTFNYQDTEERVSDSQFTEQSHVLAHTLDPATTYTVSNLASYSRLTSSGALGTDVSRQVSSTAFWRPQLERPLRITANALLRDRSVDDSSSVDSRVASARASGLYRWTDNLDMSFGTSVTDEDTAGGRRRTLVSENVGLGYAPDGYELGEFTYSWNTGASAAATQSSAAPNSEQITGNLGHGLRREWLVRGAPLEARISQRGSATADSQDQNRQSLTHSGNLSWSLSRERTQFFASVDVSDNRVYDEDETVFQLANLQFSSNLRLSRYRSLNGSVTAQASRSRSGGSEGFSESFSTSADLSYRDVRFMGIRNLDYLSQLRWRTTDIAFLLDSEDQEDVSDKSWRNRWTYGIGLLDLSLDSLLSAQRDNELAYSLVFQIRRRFSLY